MKRRKTKKLDKIDGLEKTSWLIFTIIYAIIFAFLSGAIKFYLPEIVFIWGIPLDIGTGVWLLGLALWGVISIFLQMYFRKS